MARRGFLAEANHQMQVAARERQRRELDAIRAQIAAERRAEQAQKAAERAASQWARASAADQKRLEKEAREARVAAMEAEAERRNLELSRLYVEIDSLLAATLEVDDYVDLAALRAAAQHPPFDRADLMKSTPPPAPIPDPPQPVFSPPAAPQGIKGMLGGKKHEKAVAEATAAHEQALIQWRSAVREAEVARQTRARWHADQEAKRVAALEAEHARYAKECEEREAAAAERNNAIDKLIADLGYGAIDAVHEYVSIVLSNSVYPAHFPVEHDFEFDPATAELRLKVLVPAPGTLPTVSAYKYVKSEDKITGSSLSQKACKDRYAGAIHQVALRSMHEVFEADRRGLIATISLQVGSSTIDPATGRQGFIPFVAVGAQREKFLELNLANVVPTATLAHLGAVVSKSPYDLTPVSTSGIRRS